MADKYKLAFHNNSVKEISYFCRISMKRISYIKLLIAASLTSIMMFMVSMHEVHYLFTEHQQHEDCHEAHLHAADEHGHCPVCKFDISLFTDEITQTVVSNNAFVVSLYTYTYQSVVVYKQVSAHALRGPPALA